MRQSVTLHCQANITQDEECEQGTVYTPSPLHSGGGRQAVSASEASLVYKVSPRQPRATQRNPVSKNKKNCINVDSSVFVVFSK